MGNRVYFIDRLSANDGGGTMTAESIAAGSFGLWLSQARAALRGNGGTEVPCGDCTGCCTSGYSVQLRPEDARALAMVPANLLVDTPGFASGQKTMPARPDGACPMLQAGRCSIYAQRPQTCLDYDCRVFAAAGIDAGGADKAAINRRVRAWRFDYPDEADRHAHQAVQSAAAFMLRLNDGAPGARRTADNRLPTSPMGIAVLAIKVYPVFLMADCGARTETATAAAIVDAGRSFDSGAAPQAAGFLAASITASATLRGTGS